MNSNLEKLQPYPFEKLNKLISQSTANKQLSPISLAIGEPQHETPDIIKNALNENLALFAKYPTTKGTDLLRSTCANWLMKRFQLSENNIDFNQNVLPVNGTREALFASAQCIVESSSNPVVLIPNPFYQIYEGAALLAGAEAIYYDCSVLDGDIPSLWEIPETIWQRCQLLYICTPGNPTGEVAPASTIEKLLNFAGTFNFVIASDECYSEIYSPESIPPMGLLHSAQNMGNDAFDHCLAFYSLSKRSNAPGLRSGFVAGSSELIDQFFKYRTYHGCAMSLPTQAASTVAWSDETHVEQNRILYDEKFNAVLEVLSEVLPCNKPDAGFYLWPPLPLDDQQFTKMLYQEQNVLTLPGSYLAREIEGHNPGKNKVRLALVAKKEECIQAAHRIREFLQKQN